MRQVLNNLSCKKHTKYVSPDTTKAIIVKGHLNQRRRMILVQKHIKAPKDAKKIADKRSTIDTEDIARFDALAAEWWDPRGAMRPLHQFTPIRVDYLLKCARRAGLLQSSGRLDNIEILDIGCGGGLLAEPIARLGAKVTGIDASEGAIMAAKAHAEQQNLDIDYLLTSSEDMTREAKNRARFDFIYASEVIEHVSDRSLFLKSIQRLLTPKGVVIITTINRNLFSFALAKISRTVSVGCAPCSKRALIR